MADPNIVPFDGDDEGDARLARYNELTGARQQQHDRFLQSNTLALRSRQQLITEELGREKIDIAHQRLELDRNRALADLLKQRVVMEQQNQTLQHTTAALSELGKLNPSQPDYSLRMAEIMHANPMASKDPTVQDIIKSQLKANEVSQVTDSHIREHEAAQASEFARIHGVDPVMKDGRVDWTASQKLADDAARTRSAQAQTDAGTTPTTIAGLPLRSLKVGNATYEQTKPAQTPAKLASAKADVLELQKRKSATEDFLKNETQPDQQKKLQDSLSKINTDLNAATIRHDALNEAYGDATPPTPTGQPAPTGVIKMKLTPDGLVPRE